MWCKPGVWSDIEWTWEPRAEDECEHIALAYRQAGAATVIARSV
jgi:hypothetical protein